MQMLRPPIGPIRWANDSRHYVSADLRELKHCFVHDLSFEWEESGMAAVLYGLTC